MFLSINRTIQTAIVLAVLAMQTAFAATIDVAANVTEIGESKGPIALIGGAVLSVIVVLAVWKWVRRAV